MKSKYLPTLLLIIIAASSCYAQLGINKFSIGYSQWNRIYSGPDERIFLSNYRPNDDFDQSARMLTVSGEISLFQNLGILKSDFIGLEGRVGLWNHEFRNEFSFDGDFISERISQRIIPATVNLLYHAEIAPKFSIYFGSGITRYFLQETLERSVSPGEGTIAPKTSIGNTYGWNNQIGFEYWMFPNLALGFEIRQHRGSYSKSYVAETGGQSSKIDVDLQGYEMGASVRFRLNPPRFDYSGVYPVNTSNINPKRKKVMKQKPV